MVNNELVISETLAYGEGYSFYKTKNKSRCRNSRTYN